MAAAIIATIITALFGFFGYTFFYKGDKDTGYEDSYPQS